MSNPDERLLLIDTCGETAGVALCAGETVVGAQDLEAGAASAQLLGAVRLLLVQSGWSLREIAAIGVVSGPGSFTGMRTGLAAGKGLCEGLGIPLIAVSRLAVLADAAEMPDAVCALDAGRGEFYVRDPLAVGAAREFLCRAEDLSGVMDGRPVVLAGVKLEQRLATLVPAESRVLRPLHVVDALRLVLRSARGVPGISALAEANYVREELDIYGQTTGQRAVGR